MREEKVIILRDREEREEKSENLFCRLKKFSILNFMIATLLPVDTFFILNLYPSVYKRFLINVLKISIFNELEYKNYLEIYLM